ncbi:MAG TPA: metalloregulator ArsR/SmtB family transcription factor [Thermoanaerobaculia bacterium]|nr:metalloregulator ArsR/SmtB family transcription factor [Thermoanaerobaculia bacterium]
MKTDAVFAALADPTRRRLVEKLSHGPRCVTELSEGLPVTRPAVSQHLKVLRGANLVRERRAGTRRYYSLEQRGFEAVRSWVDRMWDDALEAFRRKAEEDLP